MTIRNACPACNHKKIGECYEINGYSIYRCTLCSSLFVFQPPSSENLAYIYSGKYYDLPIESISRIQYENRRRLKKILKYKSTGSILDIGCAQGNFLDEARSLGFKTYGIELSLENVNIARLKGHTIFHGDLNEYYVQTNTIERFDIVSCLDVIEHVSDPALFLRQAITFLKNNGMMVLTTPNYSGALAQVLRDKEPYMTPPEHLNFFTQKGMLHLFRKNGLQQKHYLTFGRLTKEELKRVTPKYFPGFMKIFSVLIQQVVPIGLVFLNFIKIGMEHEFYLTREIKK